MSERPRVRSYAAAFLCIATLVVSLLTGPAGGPVAPVSAQTTQSVSKDYVLIPGDTVDIVVFGEADLTRSVVIRPDGKISLPLIGEVEAAGQTPTQLAERIATMLRTYLRNPQVSITVTQLQRLFVTVVGQASRPGSIEIQRGWTLLDVMGAAGGTTPRAAMTKATITRKDTVIPVDLDRLLVKGDKSANVAVEPGDIVTIPVLQNRVVVLGYVGRQGAYDLEAGARVFDAIAAAGGISLGNAATSRVGLLRLGPDNKPHLVTQIDLNKMAKGDVSQNVELQDKDVIYVPQSPLVIWREIISWLTGYSLIRTLWPTVGI